jgi:hypothetical protein
MRIYLLILIFNLLFLKVFAQNHSYHVLTMKGSVVSKNMGREFQTGDIISTDDELTFKGTEDMVGLVRSDGKRFILKNVEEKKGARLKYSESKMIGKTRIEWKNLTLSTLDDLKEYFTEAPYIFLDSVAKVRINNKTFPQNGAQFFYFHFYWKSPKGEEEVDKKLEYKRDTLILRQSSIFKVDKKPIEMKDVREYSMVYYNRGELVKIGLFNVIFPDQEKMKAEVRMLVEKMQKNNFSPKVIHGEVEAFIRQFYGSIDKINLVLWLKNNFNVPIK